MLYEHLVKPILDEYKLVYVSGTYPTIVLGDKTWLEITDQQWQRGKSYWFNSSFRFVATYSLEQVLDNPNLFIDFMQDITIPALYPVESEPNPQVEIEYGIPTHITSGVVSFDLETTGYNSITNQILLISVTDRLDKAWIITPDMWKLASEFTKLCDLFLNPNIQWLAHNGKFDIRFLRNQLGIVPYLTHDSMLLHYVLDERVGTHGLKQLCSERLALPDYEKELTDFYKKLRKKDKNYGDIPQQILHKYASMDCCFTLALFNQLREEIFNHPNDVELCKVYEFIMTASNEIGDIENNGLLIDKEALQVVENDLIIRITELRQQLIDMTEREIQNPNSNKQVAEYLYVTCGYKIPKVKAKTELPANIEAVEKLLALHPDNEFLSRLIEYREMCKILSTYIIGIKDKIDPDNRIRTDYKLHGTVTGRLSSSEPNLQNIPKPKKNKFSKPIRNMFIVPDGYTLVGADLAQAELRVPACISREQSMKDAWENGIDMHTQTAMDAFGVTDPKLIDSNMRDVGKTLNFSVMYGKQAPTLASQWGIPVKQAQGYLDKFFAGKPMLKAYLDSKKQEAQDTCQIVAKTGRIRRFGMITQNNLHRVLNQAINFEVQGMAGDINTLASGWMNQWCKKNQPTSKVVLMVHDAIYVECKDEHTEQVVTVLCDFMSKAGKEILNDDWIIIKADAKTAKRWGQL